MIRWSSLSPLEQELLSLATEDWYGLHEAVMWGRDFVSQARSEDQWAPVVTALQHLHDEGLIFLCHGYSDDQILSPDEVSAIWREPGAWEPNNEPICFAATPQGERIYYRIDALLLAAGESTRMGRPKALLPWGGVTLIEYQVRELLAARCQVIVVLGHVADDIRPHVPAEARVVVNEAYREGRASSLRAGAAALPDDADTIVVLNVDQPRPREVIETLTAAHRTDGALVTIPKHEGKHGHPPVLSGALLTELRTASEEARGLRGVIAAHEGGLREVEVDAPIVLLDLNTDDDYQRALAEFGPSLQT